VSRPSGEGQAGENNRDAEDSHAPGDRLPRVGSGSASAASGSLGLVSPRTGKTSANFDAHPS
jgi:hypothetical protein